MANSLSIPSSSFPNDSLRQPIRDLYLGKETPPPTLIIQKNGLRREESERMKRERMIYGLHAPLKMRMERLLLSTSCRLPGLRSSMAGLEVVMGIDDTIDMEDYLNVESPEAPIRTQAVHDLLEAKFCR